jgi:hypothetical protein
MHQGLHTLDELWHTKWMQNLQFFICNEMGSLSYSQQRPISVASFVTVISSEGRLLFFFLEVNCSELERLRFFFSTTFLVGARDEVVLIKGRFFFGTSITALL